MGEGARSFGALQAHHPLSTSVCSPKAQVPTPSVRVFVGVHQQRLIKSLAVRDQLNLPSLCPPRRFQMGLKLGLIPVVGSPGNQPPSCGCAPVCLMSIQKDTALRRLAWFQDLCATKWRQRPNVYFLLCPKPHQVYQQMSLFQRCCSGGKVTSTGDRGASHTGLSPLPDLFFASHKLHTLGMYEPCFNPLVLSYIKTLGLLIIKIPFNSEFQ